MNPRSTAMHCAKEPTALILSLERLDYLRELP